MEKTLVILKPSAIQRAIVGEIISRFEKKGLQLVGIKMTQLTEELVNQHYAHLSGKPFFQDIKESMLVTPVIVTCWRGVEAVKVVRMITGKTNGRDAMPGTIRGDFSVSVQENIIHTSDTIESAKKELSRFFEESEIFNYKNSLELSIYASDEI